MRHPHGDRSGRRNNRLSPFHSWTVATKAIQRLVLLSLAFVSSPRAGAQTVVEPPRTIRVVMDNAYPPYVFQSDDGKLQGSLIDQWRAWEQETGINVELHAMGWGEAPLRMRAGQFDVIDCILERPDARNDFDF